MFRLVFAITTIMTISKKTSIPSVLLLIVLGVILNYFNQFFGVIDRNFMPLLDCVKDVQDPDNIVPKWVNGGEDTRSYINRAEFNKHCNWQGRNRNFSI